MQSRSKRVRVEGEGGNVIAVDIGASKIIVSVFRRGVEVSSRIVKTPRGISASEMTNFLIRLIEEVTKPSGRISVIGIASVGPLDLERGMVVNAPNMSPNTFKLRDPIGEYFNARVVLANDCVAALWGEYLLGGWSSVENQVYITISSGIGAGVMVDGRILLGRRGNAHEVGHIVLDLDSDSRCGCGGLGHWEAIASGLHVISTATKIASSWRGSKTKAINLLEEGKLDTIKLYELARKGDEFALAVVDYLNKVHAAGIASVMAVYDPEVVHLGGSVYINNEDLILPKLLEYLKVYTISWPRLIRTATFKLKASLYGAYALALKTPSELEKYTYNPGN